MQLDSGPAPPLLLTIVTFLTGEYRVKHPPRVEASVVVKRLEEDWHIPFRSTSKGGGCALGCGTWVLDLSD